MWSLIRNTFFLVLVEIKNTTSSFRLPLNKVRVIRFALGCQKLPRPALYARSRARSAFARSLARRQPSRGAFSAWHNTKPKIYNGDAAECVFLDAFQDRPRPLARPTESEIGNKTLIYGLPLSFFRSPVISFRERKVSPLLKICCQEETRGTVVGIANLNQLSCIPVCL